MEEAVKENKMGTMKIPRLLFSVSVPIIISMLVQAMYNIVDSIYVAQFNPNEGTEALTIAFPIQNLMIAVAVGLAVGMNALLSRSLGEKNFEKANVIAGQGLFLTFCGYLLFLIIGVFFVSPYVSIQAGGNALLQEYGVEYLAIVCIGSLGVFVQVVVERLLQATGKSFFSMITQLSGAVVNIILDPILIFTFDMGVAGAAIATIVGQFFAAGIGIVLNLAVNKELCLKIRNMLPRAALIKDMLIIGIPSVLVQAIGSVMTFSMNMILGGFEGARNVFGVYFKLQSFVFMPIFGLNNGMVPIIAYNYGAKKRGRVFATIKLSAVVAVGYMLLGLMVFHAFPNLLLGLFDAGKQMLAVGAVAFRRISLSFVFAGFSIIASVTCQALGKSIYSMFISMGRQLVVLIPVAFLLSLSGNVDLIWWAFPIAEIMSLTLGVIFLLRVIKKSFPKEPKI